MKKFTFELINTKSVGNKFVLQVAALHPDRKDGDTNSWLEFNLATDKPQDVVCFPLTIEAENVRTVLNHVRDIFNPLTGQFRATSVRLHDSKPVAA